MLSFVTLPLWLSGALVLLFGILIGSFLNVVIIRMSTGKGIGGRSMCMSCAKTLAWYDLVPLFSFLVLRGRCRWCGACISALYPLVETVTGLSFLLVWLSYGWSIRTPIAVFVVSILIVLSVYDWRHTVIPNRLSYTLLAMAGLTMIPELSLGGENIFQELFNNNVIDHVLAMGIVAGPFFLIWLYSHGRWFGLGDVKVMMAMGLFLGTFSAIGAVFVAFWLAMAYVMVVGGYQGIYNVLITKGLVRRSRKSILKREIPFGPFLSLSLFLSLLGIQVIALFF